MGKKIRGWQGYNFVVIYLAGFNSPMKKVSLTLTPIKGPEVAGCDQDMVLCHSRDVHPMWVNSSPRH